jgi:DNA polymerase-3 subunit epsilon
MSSGSQLSPLSVRDAVERCGGEIWFLRDRAAQRSRFRFLLPLARPRSQPVPATVAVAATESGRPEFYDFDLFRWTDTGGALDSTPLARIAYTVFDTETTGLDPAGGDEIIQIGAVRIVNRRLLRQETFDQLVDPGRALPASSVRVHGITAAMLAGAPPLGRVLPVFRAFVADTVLVAHNAAFDMRFLELKEAATGVRFDRPVLDTFLLSAVLFPSESAHGLDTIAARLGVAVIGRHTALGDALVTGEVFLRMLDLLAQRGIHTLHDALTVSARTLNAQIRY